MLTEKPLAVGATAEVYEWHDNTVLKLFRLPFSPEAALQEAHIARQVQEAGLPIPALIEVTEFAGRPGLIYERVEGISMMEVFARQPWLLMALARLTAKLHYDLHCRSLSGLRLMRKQLEQKIMVGQLDLKLKQAVLNALRAMPDGDKLCHGDFHPGNILISTRGAVIIDWMDATSGYPLADVARTLVVAGYGNPPDSASTKIAAFIFREVYLRRYLTLSGAARRDVMRWIPIIAAARLSEDVSGKDDLRELVRKAYPPTKK